MAAKGSKKVVQMYNRVARALVEYEIVWHESWLQHVNAAAAALNSTLLYQDPRTGGEL
jgi:dynein heavy chain